MVGTLLALSLGVPAGTWLGALVGWRACFGLMSVLALLLRGWISWRVPDFAGQARGNRLQLGAVLRPVLFVVLGCVLALLVFGLASLAGIWIVGGLIDRLGVSAFSPALLVLLLATLLVVARARQHGFA